MAHVTNRWTEHCHCQHGCPTYAEITERSCGCVEVEIYQDQGSGWDCTNFSGMRRSCGKPHREALRSQSTEESDDDSMPLALSLIIGFYAVVFGGLFLLLRWIVRRPWRVILALCIVGGIAAAIYWNEELGLGSPPMQTTAVTSETAVTNEAAIASEAPITSEPALSQPSWAVTSLGSYSDGFYQVDLWSDDSAGGQLLGRILRFSEDVSKTPAAGELTDIIGDGMSGPLRFAAKLRDEEISFVGVVKDGALLGMFSSTRVPEPESIVLNRGERQYEENYESRLQWSESTAELLACCGPGTQSASDATSDTYMEQGGDSEPAPSEEWATLTVQEQEDGDLAAQSEEYQVDQAGANVSMDEEAAGESAKVGVGFEVMADDVPLYSSAEDQKIKARLAKGTLCANARGRFLGTPNEFRLEEKNGRVHVAYLHEMRTMKHGWVDSSSLERFTYECACSPARCTPINFSLRAHTWNDCFDRAIQARRSK